MEKKTDSISVILGVKNLVNKGNLKGRRRTANKGLSPVIAAVILIAVTVAIAVAAGGYFFGLFGTQTSRAQASVRSTTLQALDGAGGTAPFLEGGGGCNTADDHLLTLEFQNAGGLADSISNVNMAGAAVTISGTNATTINANVGSVIINYCANSGTYTVGQTVSFTLRMSSGLTIPVAVTVE